MSAESWKIENDLCRCCHSEGSHKNFSEPCLEGEEETYSDMLQLTLDINMTPVSGPLSTVTFTICETCILRLQDAWSFKQQVLQCETRFHDLYTKNIIKMEPDTIIIDVKKEAVDSDDEDFKEEKLVDVSDDDFAMSYDDGMKSDDSEGPAQKAKPKPKPKAKGRAKAKAPPKKKPAARPTTTKAVPKETEAEEKKGDDDEFTMPYILSKRDGVKQYICDVCQKPFDKLSNFSQHYRHVHLKLRPKVRSCYMCPVKVPSHLRTKHLEEAHGKPRPQCYACGKKFAYPFQVIRHQKSFHMNEKPYACSMCDLTFPVPSGLAKHARKHSSIRPYQCEYCEKSFKWKKNLTIHIMMHLDDRRHVCFVCNEAFVQSTSLKYHVTKKHPEIA